MLTLGLWWTAYVMIAVQPTGGSHSELLVCLPVGFFLAAVGAGPYGVLQAAGLSSALLLGTAWILGPHGLGESAHRYLGVGGEWMFVATIVGLLAARLEREGSDPGDEIAQQHRTARSLLDQLHSVAARLPGSLDLTTTAEMMLDGCLRSADATLGGVLLHVGDGYHVPIALRGSRRLPWRSPTAEYGPLRSAWQTGQPVLEARTADREDTDGHRRVDSALLVVPILSSGGVLGLVALQGSSIEQFSPAVVDDVCVSVQRFSTQLETAYEFERVRSAVTAEERGRLARDMHDGVAQDLAYIGFELDHARAIAAKVEPELAESLAALRRETTRIISDVRASISDLKSSQSIDRGLGAALSSFVRNAGAAGRLTVHLSLQESPFRLPNEVEIELLRVAQDFTAAARTDGQASNLWVTLVVDPPMATLRLEHDGPSARHPRGLAAATARLETVGGTLTIEPRLPNGLYATATIEGGAQCL